MSPSTAAMPAAPGLARSRSSMCGESSMPDTGTPRSANGSATRPVPTASSSARPSPARSASRSTVGPSVAGSNRSAESSSYVAAISSSNQILVVPEEPRDEASRRAMPPTLAADVRVGHRESVPTMARMYAVQLAFSDDPARLELRPAHRERLASLVADGRLLAAGPWSDDSGALLVFLVDSRDELDEVMGADGYYTAPGVSVAGIHEWNPVTQHAALDDI